MIKAKKKTAKAVKKALPASRGPKAGGAQEVYALPESSRHYGKIRGWYVADQYQKTGKTRAPKEGEVFLGSDGIAVFATFTFPASVRREILKPVREVPRPPRAK